MKSKIRVVSATKIINIEADDEKNKFIRNFKEYNIPVKMFNLKLKTIVKDWPDKLNDSSVLDSTSYKIAIKDGNNVYKKEGNLVPKHFSQFINLITGGFDD